MLGGHFYEFRTANQNIDFVGIHGVINNLSLEVECK